MNWYDPEREDTTIYKVVFNHEEQYSIWPAERENPLGWLDAGKTGSKAECLAHIKEVWTDITPLSVRKRMQEASESRAQVASQPSTVGEPSGDAKEDNLVTRLSQGEHPVEVSLRPEKSMPVLKEHLDRGFLNIKFTDTRGETELGVRLDRDATDVSQADFDNHAGTLHLEGGLKLDFVSVRCVADVNLNTLAGTGHLVLLSA
jgi:uncharacterized protein YbdZ (MbtH family)